MAGPEKQRIRQLYIDPLRLDVDGGELGQPLDHPALRFLHGMQLFHALFFPKHFFGPHAVGEEHEEKNHQDRHEIAVGNHPELVRSS